MIFTFLRIDSSHEGSICSAPFRWNDYLAFSGTNVHDICLDTQKGTIYIDRNIVELDQT